ncbi:MULTISPECIES: hypothetical protein [Empedobacter]|uniref:hypothetical protein n=1 Tax=Empedobacter TaxID=59734 RepID=UPI001C55F532|nr:MULTISPECIES: hypothetical protein [Empedobacter]MBW1619038.1 hypothetical protein [Empedobacter falsenii]MDM1040228.1 hypothetical protein [Empedobacter brevis]MDM1134160.1 hypothetical protein [Empedobacter sp. R750]
MNKKELAAYNARKLENMNKAKQLIKHPFIEKEGFVIQVECTEKEHSAYCAKLGFSGMYSDKSGKGSLLNFYQYK